MPFPEPWIRDLVTKQLAENLAQLRQADFKFDEWLALVREDQVYEVGRNSSFPLHPAHYWTHIAGRQVVDFVGRVEQFEACFREFLDRVGIGQLDPVNDNVVDLQGNSRAKSVWLSLRRPDECAVHRQNTGPACRGLRDLRLSASSSVTVIPGADNTTARMRKGTIGGQWVRLRPTGIYFVPLRGHTPDPYSSERIPDRAWQLWSHKSGKRADAHHRSRPLRWFGSSCISFRSYTPKLRVADTSREAVSLIPLCRSTA